MSKHTIIIDAKTNETKSLLNMIIAMSKRSKYIKVNPDTPNKETLQAMKDAELGKTTRFTNWDDFENDM
jgi:hypothetical protein